MHEKNGSIWDVGTSKDFENFQEILERLNIQKEVVLTVQKQESYNTMDMTQVNININYFNWLCKERFRAGAALGGEECFGWESSKNGSLAVLFRAAAAEIIIAMMKANLRSGDGTLRGIIDVMF